MEIDKDISKVTKLASSESQVSESFNLKYDARLCFFFVFLPEQ